MKSGWVTKRLGEVCETVTPPLKLKACDYLPSGKYPVVSQDDVLVCGYANQDQGLIKLKRPVVIFGDHTKAVKYVDFDFVQGADGVKILEANASCDPRYLYYVVLNAPLRSLGYARHFKLLKQADLNFPESLPEQRRIVAKIDAAFAKIDRLKANAEKNRTNAKELFQSALNEVLRPKPGWVEKRLGEMCDIVSELVDPTEKKFRKCLHIGGANIVSETGELIELKTAEEEKLRSGKFPFDSSMVLYNKIRPYLKKVARPDFSGLCSADMYPLKPNDDTDKDFLYYALLSSCFTSYAMANSERAGMPKLNRVALFAYETSWPQPKREQTKIAQGLDVLSKSCATLQCNYTRLIADCAEMRQTVLKEAFEGRL